MTSFKIHRLNFGNKHSTDVSPQEANKNTSVPIVYPDLKDHQISLKVAVENAEKLLWLK